MPPRWPGMMGKKFNVLCVKYKMYLYHAIHEYLLHLKKYRRQSSWMRMIVKSWVNLQESEKTTSSKGQVNIKTNDFLAQQTR